MLKSMLSIALGLAAVPALAAEAPQPPTRAVFYGDLDLGSAAGAAELDRRIGHAIVQVCGRAGPLELRERSAIQRCRASAQASFAEERTILLAAARNARGGTAVASR